VRAAVDERAPAPRSEVRWVRLEGIHVTLRFLGPTAAERLPEVVAAVDRAATAARACDVRIGGAGAFPSPRRPRALWLGITEGAEALADAAQALDRELEPLGWAPEQRPFRAHLTLARADGRREGPLVAEVLAEQAAGLDVAFRADRLTLFESLTGGGPARYVARHEVVLPAA
jgi:2'-5' RNA ligase